MELEKIKVKEVDEMEVRVLEKVEKVKKEDKVEKEVEVKNFFINFIK
jgi:hypothetical protein